MELASYGKFGFSRPDIEGNKLAKGMFLARKQEIKKCLSSGTEGRQFFCSKLKLASKGLKQL